MGLTASIYQDSDLIGDCSNNGISNRHTRICLINVEGPDEPDSKTPACRLIVGHLPGTVIIKPVCLEGKVTMFGGSFAYTCDSRFHQAMRRITGHISYGPAPIHDRVE